MTLRWRLAALVALGTAILYALLGVIFMHQLRTNLDASVDGDLLQSSGFMSRILDVQAVNYQFGQQQITEFPAFPGMQPPNSHGSPLFGQLLSSDGTVIGSVDLPTAQPLLSSSQIQAALQGPIHVDVNPSGVSGTIRLLAEPATSLPGYVQVTGVPLGTGPDAEHDDLIAFLAFFGPVVVMAGAMAWLLAGAALRPVDRMRAQAETISANDDDVRLAVPGTRDELSSLARTMNGLLERLHGALVQQRSFVSDAGHELRTPIAILKGELELASKPGRSEDELRDAIAVAYAETERLNRLTDDMLQLAKGDEGHLALQFGRVSLQEVARSSAGRLRPRATSAGIALVTEAPEEIVLRADETRLQQAVGNLLDNALRYAPRGTAVTLGVRREGDSAFIEVVDAGPGFPVEYLGSVFERFRRPDDARARGDGGSGLGLAIVRSIAEGHGGRAEANNVSPHGARVAIVIPIVSADEEPAGPVGVFGGVAGNSTPWGFPSRNGNGGRVVGGDHGAFASGAGVTEPAGTEDSAPSKM